MIFEYLPMVITGLFWAAGLMCLVSDKSDRAKLGLVFLVIGTFIYFVSGGFDLRR
jgi:hypothetical protein